jgi:hypothetical protein
LRVGPNYMPQGEGIGLLAFNGAMTPAGKTLAQLPDSHVLDFLSVRFGMSVVGVGGLGSRIFTISILNRADILVEVRIV